MYIYIILYIDIRHTLDYYKVSPVILTPIPEYQCWIFHFKFGQLPFEDLIKILPKLEYDAFSHKHQITILATTKKIIARNLSLFLAL